jgi:hypothetical protein
LIDAHKKAYPQGEASCHTSHFANGAELTSEQVLQDFAQYLNNSLHWEAGQGIPKHI